MNSNLKIIAAVARNGAIGLNNRLLYWLPNDMKRFRQLTTGNTIIMGRNTFDSLPKGALPNRRNVVLSTTVNELPGCDVYPSLQEALDSCSDDDSVYVIGGARVYAEAMPLATQLCLTEVDDTPEDADAFFPDYSQWSETWRENHVADERHAFAYSFVDYTLSPNDKTL